MLALIDDLVTRLTPLGVPVLRPEQSSLPHQSAPLDAQGRPKVGGGERGLGAYLAAHPQGYVQIENPLAITASGVQEQYWIPVGAVALHPGVAEALAMQVRALLSGNPSSDPGVYLLVLPPQLTPITDTAALCRATYAATLLLGELPV